jgi:hypothetical protein
VAQAKRRPRLNVAWYGGGRRDIAVVTGTGQWYRSGAGLAAVRWVWVHDCTGTHRDEYFFTTAVGWTAAQVIETYTGRWNLETTFAEMRSCLGLETTRGRTAQTVSRVAPCLFGLYTVVVAWYVALPVRRCLGGGEVARQAGRNVLRRPDGRQALAVGRLGFCNPRSRYRVLQTEPPLPTAAAGRLAPRTLTLKSGHKLS